MDRQDEVVRLYSLSSTHTYWALLTAGAGPTPHPHSLLASGSTSISTTAQYSMVSSDSFIYLANNQITGSGNLYTPGDESTISREIL